MATASIKVTRSKARKRTLKNKTGKKRGNPNKCPTCGKFVGSGNV